MVIHFFSAHCEVFYYLYYSGWILDDASIVPDYISCFSRSPLSGQSSSFDPLSSAASIESTRRISSDGSKKQTGLKSTGLTALPGFFRNEMKAA